jgi:hypothetical protein
MREIRPHMRKVTNSYKINCGKPEGKGTKKNSLEPYEGGTGLILDVVKH